MNDPQNSVEALRAELAALRARIDRLEQRAGIPVPLAPEPSAKAVEHVTAPPVIPLTPPSASMLTPPAPTAPSPPPLARATQATATVLGKREPEALESKIGQLWLNRIGIF